MGVALLAGFFVPQVPPSRLVLGLLALVIFILSFINIEWGLYILIFSMLLSPEFMAGQTDGGALGRGITLRLEDFLLVVIGLSWFARTAVKKELGLFFKNAAEQGHFVLRPGLRSVHRIWNDGRKSGVQKRHPVCVKISGILHRIFHGSQPSQGYGADQTLCVLPAADLFYRCFDRGLADTGRRAGERAV